MNQQTVKEKVILIVEDEKSLAKVLGLKLANAGYKVIIASNGKSALAEITKNRYDLILLDLLMPEMDGWAVLSKLQGSQNKIIVISNLGQEEDIKKAKTLGCLDYLIKSNTPLVNIVQKVNAVLS